MTHSGRHALLAAAVLLMLAAAAAAARQPQPDGALAPAGSSGGSSALERRHRKHKKPYTSPAGLFIQERASKQLPGPGQHFSFGAIKPWEEIVALLDGKPDRKLLLVVRHGQAISNYLGDTLGPDEWFVVEGTCQYDDKKGTVYDIFDADLTGLGEDQAKSLNSMLSGGGWFSKVTGDKPTRAIISPLTRCLHTADIVLGGLSLNATNVEEYVRETLGEDTCDARRSVSDPPKHGGDGGNDGDDSDDGHDSGDAGSSKKHGGGDGKKHHGGPCPFRDGLRTKFPGRRYVVYDPRDGARRGLGLLGDEDTLWTKDARERQKHQVKRAKAFLDVLFEHAPEQVVVVVTHSGFTRSILLAVQREPYRPQNAELVPVIVDKHSRRRGSEAEAGDASAGAVGSGSDSGSSSFGGGEEDEDAWIDEVLAAHGLDGDDEALSDVGELRQQAQAQRTQRGGCLLRRALVRLAAPWGGSSR